MLKAINIGSLDRRISIQQNTGLQAADGLPLEQWSNLFTNVPAKREYGTSGLKEDAGEQVPEQEVKYLIRYYSGIDTTFRIVEGGKIYLIESVEEIGRRQGLLLHCKWYGNEQ